MDKIRLATVWLDGCSGCHMSFLDMDERLIELAPHLEVVYSPYIDTKVFPEDVDVSIVEGAVSSDHDLALIKTIRRNSHKVVALGDCAITGNVSAMKNLYGSDAVLERGYFALADQNATYPKTIVPKLLERVIPLHEAVSIDLFIPGCPTPADAIYETIKAVIEQREPNLAQYTRFGK
jgi:NAD-reducing hydrogenase small subunit